MLYYIKKKNDGRNNNNNNSSPISNRQGKTTQYSSYSRDLPPAPPIQSDSDIYSDLSSTFSSSHLGTSNHDFHNNNHNNQHRHQNHEVEESLNVSTTSRRSIIDKLLDTDRLTGTTQGQERRELARLERQAARQAKKAQLTASLPGSTSTYSYEPSSSRRNRTLMA